MDYAAGLNLPEGYVQASAFWLYAGDRPVGFGKLRHRLNDTLRRDGGHIGYGVRPTERGRGYGSALLSRLLDEAAKLGIEQALITVNTHNEPSKGVAIGNGGKLTETIGDKHLFRIPTGLTGRLRNALQTKGAARVGFSDLGELPEAQRQGFPRGISIAMPWDPEALRSIADGPTPAYHANYDDLNRQLDALAAYAEGWLLRRGHRALGKTRAVVSGGESDYDTLLPHKTVATRAGVGWIGKCALLVTREFGSAIRISSILTDAPLDTSPPINESSCGDCGVCKAACPAGAVSGIPWRAGLPRDAFWDAEACRRTARERSLRSLGEHITLCGLCILRCPWTQRYLENNPPI